MHTGQCVEVALGIETSAERTHTQVGDARRLALLQDTQPLGLGPTVDPETALRANLVGLAADRPGVRIDTSAQPRVLVGGAQREPAVGVFADAPQNGLARNAIDRVCELDPTLSLQRAERAMAAFVSSEEVPSVLAALDEAGLR